MNESRQLNSLQRKFHAHLMISKKMSVMSSFSYISYWLTSFGTLVMKENSFFNDRSGQLGSFYFLLNRTVILMILPFSVFFEYFSKDSYMSKNVVLKNKAIYKLMLLVHKEKNYQEIIKISITKLFI